MQARCHLLNDRVLTSEKEFDEAGLAQQAAQRLYQEADLLCPICQQAMGMQAENIQILTCTHIFHQRYRRNPLIVLSLMLCFSLGASRICCGNGLIKPNLVQSVSRVFYSVEAILHYPALDRVCLFFLTLLLGEQFV